MIRLFVSSKLESGCAISITGSEYHYLTRVRRTRSGEKIEVRDRAQQCYFAEIRSIDAAQVEIEIGEQRLDAPHSFPLILLVAVPKRKLLDDLVRSLSEIGAERLIPLLTERSVARPSESRLARWRKIAKESERQCGRAAPLIVDELCPFSALPLDLNTEGTNIILHPAASLALSALLNSEVIRAPLTIAVGPEGGFTSGEIAFARKSGFVRAALGASTLRVETAAYTAAVLAIARLGGFG